MAHLFHQWQQFRTAYRLLEKLKIEFPITPIIALTATAPPDIMESLKMLVREPLVVRGSVNRPNIYLECEEIPTSIKNDDFVYFASRVIANQCTIIYTDLINNVGKIVSSRALTLAILNYHTYPCNTLPPSSLFFAFTRNTSTLKRFLLTKSLVICICSTCSKKTNA